MKPNRGVFMGFLLWFVTITAAHAAVVTWNVDATFNDGGHATGFFEFDSAKFAATGNGLGNFDILTTRGNLIAGTEYLSGFLVSSALATRFATDITNDLGHLALMNASALPDVGGTVRLAGGQENFGSLAARIVVAGQLVSEVPEASQVTFMIVVAAGLAAALFLRLCRRGMDRSVTV